MVTIICILCKIEVNDAVNKNVKYCYPCRKRMDKSTSRKTFGKEDYDVTKINAPVYTIQKNCKQCNKQIMVENNRTKICKECRVTNQRNRCQDYKKRNPEKIKKMNDRNHNDPIKKENEHMHNKIYFQDNKQKLYKKRNEKLKTDKKFKISITKRGKLNYLFRKYWNIKDNHKYIQLLQCNSNIFIQWIKFQMTSEMNIENYGQYWNLDHVYPCKIFILTNDDELNDCMNWSNIRPHLKNENSIKSSKVHTEDVENHFKILWNFTVTILISNYGFDFTKLLYTQHIFFKMYRKYWPRICENNKNINAKFNVINYISTTSDMKISEGSRLNAEPDGKNGM